MHHDSASAERTDQQRLQLHQIVQRVGTDGADSVECSDASNRNKSSSHHEQDEKGVEIREFYGFSVRFVPQETESIIHSRGQLQLGFDGGVLCFFLCNA